MGRIHKVTNFDRLVGDIKDRDPEQVFVNGDRYLPGGATVAIGDYGDFIHGLLYRLELGKKERSYREELFTTKNQGRRGWNPEQTASIALSTGLVVLAAEARLNMLQSALPDIEVAILDTRTDKPMEQDELARARDRAVNAGASAEVSQLFL